MQTKQYGFLDIGKLVASLLVVAIHTSPLESISTSADFFITRILARVAVPFFFMVTGFFLFRTRDTDKIKSFLKKTTVLYVMAMILYLPIGIYAGQYQGVKGWNILRLVVFDGTFYHLWYLPASILGVSLLVLGSTRISFRRLGAITVFLYVIGLFGDSYYGVILEVPIVKGMYDMLFQYVSYTRNGIFFAPMFLWLGAYAGIQLREGNLHRRRNPQWLMVGCLLSFLFMTIEAFVLRAYDLQRHDSMYVLLVPTMYFMFLLLISSNKAPNVRIRTISLVTYLVHPISILGVRMMAKLSGTAELLVENSIIYYSVVCLISIGVGMLYDRLRRKEENHARINFSRG